MTDDDLRPVAAPGVAGEALRLFGNAVVWHPTRTDLFGIVDKRGIVHWIEVGFR